MRNMPYKMNDIPMKTRIKIPPYMGVTRNMKEQIKLRMLHPSNQPQPLMGIFESSQDSIVSLSVGFLFQSVDAVVLLRGGEFFEKLAGGQSVDQSAEVFGPLGAYRDAVGTGEAFPGVEMPRVFFVDGSGRALCGADTATVAVPVGLGFQRRIHRGAVGIVTRHVDAG